MSESEAASGPDFSLGVDSISLPPGSTLGGRVGDEPVLLSNIDGEYFAVAGACTHYGGNLADGSTEHGQVRCPLHHACFDLRTGAALRAPALDPLDRWKVQIDGGKLFVRSRIESQLPSPQPETDVRRVVIVGGGAAGLACANELRQRGFGGSITILSADSDPPCDRPNLSKDYLAGKAPEEWLWLRADNWYEDNDIDLRLATEVTGVDPAGRTVSTESSGDFPFDRLLIATGSEPKQLPADGFDRSNVFTLRSVADARALANEAGEGSRAVVVGASFIALEAAAALRQRGVEVDIVSVEEIPLEHVFGTEIGKHLQALHERNGVRFHLNSVVRRFDGHAVWLGSGESLRADFVLVGIGVRPRTRIAESIGIAGAQGVLVDKQLETDHQGIYAAGDIAAYPDPFTGEPIRVEHWVTAERQGQVAAANMLGATEHFEAVPFFWTEQFGVTIRYIGRASGWNTVTLEGSFEDGALIARYFADGTHCATATIGEDRRNLEDELMLEARIAAETA